MDKEPRAQGAPPAGIAGAPALSERQRKHLRALAHALRPVIHLGNAGLTAAVARETERALRDHELIKVRAPAGDPAARAEPFVARPRHTRRTPVHRTVN